MPQPYREQVSNVAPIAAPKAGAALDVVARPVSTFEGAAVDPLTQLGQALGGFVAPVAAMANQEVDKEIEEARAAGIAAAQRNAIGNIRGELPPPPPTGIAAAYPNHYTRAYRKAAAERAARQSADDILNDYNAKKIDPDFNFGQWADTARATAVHGVNDPYMQGAIGGALDNSLSHAQADYRSIVEKRTREDNLSNFSSAVSSLLGPGRTADTIVPELQALQERYRPLGITRSESAKLTLDAAIGASTGMGGGPHLFEIFEQKVGTTGLTLADMNPAMKDAIAGAKKHAQDLNEHTFIKATMANYEEAHARLNANVKSGAYDDLDHDQLFAKFSSEINPTGLFRHEGSYARFAAQVAESRDRRLAENDAIKATAAGRANALDPKVQEFVLNKELAPHHAGLIATIDNPAKEAVDTTRASMQKVFKHLELGNYTIKDKLLEGYVNSVKVAQPKAGDSPPPRFQRLAELYGSMKASRNPQLLNQYFDEDTRILFESYNHSTVNGQIASPTAYADAYAMNDPVRRKQADEWFKDPANGKMVHETSRKAVLAFGSRFWQALPFTANANSGYVEADASMETRKLISRGITNPDLIKEHLDTYAKANYYFDPESTNLVKVPPAMNNPSTQEAITEYMKLINKAKPNLGASLNYVGDDKYDLVLTKGGYENLAQGLSLSNIVSIHNAKKTVSPNELQQLAALTNKAIDKTFTGEDLKANEGLIAKVRSLNFLSAPLSRAVDSARVSVVDQKVPEVVSKIQSAVTQSPTKLQPIRPQNSDTKSVVNAMLEAGNHAGALTVMGEAVSLTAYRDKGGRNTIGVGYNLDANRENIPEDFRKAGIPADKIDMITAGKMSLTPDQAVRLYEVIKPRYESIAKSVMEKREAGSWARTPGNVKAVLTDMAYQLGPKGLNEFNKGLDSLIRGDYSGEGLSVLVTDKATGKKSVDTRRTNLRLALLQSPSQLEALIRHANSKPTSPIEQRTNVASR